MKTTFSILTKALVPVAAAALLSGSASAELISHYTFDDTLVNGVSGAPDGTIVSDPAYVPGKFGKALDFDGNDAITTTTGGLPNKDSGLPIGSVAFWINTTMTTTFVVAGTVDTGTKTMWVIQGNRTLPDTQLNQHLRMFMRDEDKNTFAASADGGNWNNGAWHHIAITWNTQTFIGDAATVAQFYINGSPVETTVVPGQAGGNGPLDNLTAYDHPMAVGAFNVRGTIQSFLTGQLDDYRVYDHVLSSDEVAQLAGVGAGGELRLAVAQSGSDLVFTWNSRSGKLYDLLSSTTLDTPPSTPWPVYDDGVTVTTDLNTDTVTIPRPADAVRFFSLLEKDAPAPLPLETFEGGAIPAGWQAIDNAGTGNTLWQVGDPATGAGTGPLTGAGGSTNCAGTNIIDTYAADADCSLITPAIAIPTDGATLTFQQWRDTEGNADDSGTINVLDGSGTFLAQLATGITGADAAWDATPSYDLSAYAGQTIKLEFVFTSDNDAVVWAGWYLDDVAVTAN